MSDTDWVPRDPRPGTNVKGDAAGAAWTYLLDRMDVRRILCIGRPSDAAVRTLDRLGTDVRIVDPQLAASPQPPGEIADGGYDVVLITSPLGFDPASRELVRWAAQQLGPGGALWTESSDASAATLLEAAGLTDRRDYWLTPRRGEMRTAVPIDDAGIRQDFAAKRIAVPSLPRPLAAVEKRWPQLGSRRAGALITNRPRDGAGVPAYLRDIARDAGIDLSGHRFGLSARGRYSSRKVIAYCYPDGAATPDVIVKMTRDPAFNDRLENEERALRHVAEDSLVDSGSAPEIRFAGVHAGLRMLGQGAVDGVPLTRAGAHAQDPAYRWVTRLGAASARRGPDAARAIRAAVEGVADGVLRTYAPEAAVASRLSEAVTAVTDRADEIPAVMLHGDCAVWNGLSRTDGTVAFLDWEASARDAPPLWDLFSLARSYVQLKAGWRGRARRRPPAASVPAIWADERVESAVTTYCQRVGLPAETVAPLFALGWGFRALREAARLRADRLAHGMYVQMLEAALEPRAMDELSRRVSGPLVPGV